jgi:hypothetical protein
MKQPVTELDTRFSDQDAVATDWEETRRALEEAELFWISTVRADGRPHVTPLVAVWLDDAIYFATGRGEQKAVNLSAALDPVPSARSWLAPVRHRSSGGTLRTGQQQPQIATGHVGECRRRVEARLEAELARVESDRHRGGRRARANDSLLVRRSLLRLGWWTTESSREPPGSTTRSRNHSLAATLTTSPLERESSRQPPGRRE